MLNPVATEKVPCICRRGTLIVEVSVNDDGIVAYSIEAVSPCTVCGFADLATARAKLPGGPSASP
ncbi:MAG: hypothetical protein Q8N23_20415 [Archangium sp.]|nr:hypothetical protein [Archangium sp.]MDP3572093.1 hypothetical protein [Archangium sp.]